MALLERVYAVKNNSAYNNIDCNFPRKITNVFNNSTSLDMKRQKSISDFKVDQTSSQQTQANKVAEAKII